MNREDIMSRIAEITARGIAYATEHADEIEQANKKSEIESENNIAKILASAKNATKKSWSIYESFKTQISCIATSGKQYEFAIRDLCSILKV